MITKIVTKEHVYELGNWNIDEMLENTYDYMIYMSYGEHSGIKFIPKEKVIEVVEYESK